MNHTPGPWEVEKDNRLGLKPRVTVRTVDKKLSISAHIGPNMEGLHPENVANAEFIVRACNSHDDLLEACHLLIGTVDDFLPNIGQCVLQDYERLNQGLIKGRAAIAKATQ